MNHYEVKLERTLLVLTLVMTIIYSSNNTEHNIFILRISTYMSYVSACVHVHLRSPPKSDFKSKKSLKKSESGYKSQ